MSKAKWIMKQYWRVGTIRTLTSLGLGMLVLGKWYYVYIPVLQDMGLIGALTFGTLLFFFFLGLGWLYDQKARMWSQKLQTTTERNPYTYVPNFKLIAKEFPIIQVLLHSVRGVLKETKESTSTLDDFTRYIDSFFKTKPIKKDIFSAEEKALEFIDEHEFSPDEKMEKGRISLRSRIKLGFETQLLRFTWIQSLTGLLQDVLIFGAFYVLIIFPWVPVEHELFFAIFGISLPLLVILTIAGWYYDKKLRVWSVDTAVKIERNPYSYVAEPYIFSRFLPFFFTYLKTLQKILIKKGQVCPEIIESLEYFEKYSQLVVSRDEDLWNALKIRKSLGNLFEDIEKRR
ncbi:MAG: hypothetical protein ACW99U_10175 [Candidatus Thorarchaeota archaeon]